MVKSLTDESFSKEEWPHRDPSGTVGAGLFILRDGVTVVSVSPHPFYLCPEVV